MSDIVTVDYLLQMLQKLHDAGNGSMEVKCRDNFLYEDEITINFLDNKIEFKGYLFNLSVTQKVKTFCDDIDKAQRRFYETISELDGEKL